MTDPTFIARVAAMLLAAPGLSQRLWNGRHQLQIVARDRLRGDLAAATWLAEAAERPSTDLVLSLASAVQRVAEVDPSFAAAIRQLIVNAYAEPDLARDLPDPTPHRDVD